jgi:hypothetical protein
VVRQRKSKGTWQLKPASKKKNPLLFFKKIYKPASVGYNAAQVGQFQQPVPVPPPATSPRPRTPPSGFIAGWSIAAAAEGTALLALDSTSTPR